MNKKKLKELINKNGGFTQFNIEKPKEKNSNTPEGAISFKGIASNGDLNRNGYIIVLEAWKKSIRDFMKNPVILLGHDMDKVIGHCTEMQITSEGLYVEGYVYDDYTDERFSRGLLNALSTGHFTKKYDFINLKNGDVLSKQDFWRRWREFNEVDDKDPMYIDNWVRRITETEIVEFSLVSIPANRKSLISSREELERWHKEETDKRAVAQNAKNLDNINVTQETMKMHTLTEADLEKYPTLAEKYSVGEAISAEAWEQIAGEKTDTNDKADETASDKKAEKSDETADDEDSTDETSGDDEDNADTSEDDTEGGDETGDTADSEDDETADDQADETDGEDDEDETAEEKIVISKDDRTNLKAEAQKARERAEELAKALENTTCDCEDDDNEDEEKSNTEKTATIKVENLEQVQETFNQLGEVIARQQEQIDHLVKSLENVPAKKGLILHNQFAKAEKADKKDEKAGNKDDEKVEKQAKEVEGVFAASGLAHLLKK